MSLRFRLEVILSIFSSIFLPPFTHQVALGMGQLLLFIFPWVCFVSGFSSVDAVSNGLFAEFSPDFIQCVENSLRVTWLVFFE